VIGEPRRNTGSSRDARGFSREFVLVVCFFCLIALLGVTALVSRMYHKRVHSLADQWFSYGEADFRAGNTKKALIEYRNALAFSPANVMFQFHLALALAADGQLPEARAYLLPLLSESPGSGEINLALARIAAQQSRVQDAMLYYNSAIYGEWSDDPIEMRWNVRKELCEFLLDHGAASQAEPALVALDDNTPSGDVAKQKAAAQLLLRGQMWSRALDEFHSVLESERNDPDALEGAGTAAFQLHNYSQAVGYLSRLPKDRASDPGVPTMLETARQIQALDPFLPGLGMGEKARRTSHALDVATARAQQCGGTNGSTTSANTAAPHSELASLLATIQQNKRTWSERNLERDPDTVSQAMGLVFQIENAAAKTCGAPSGENLALWTIGQNLGNNLP